MRLDSDDTKKVSPQGWLNRFFCFLADVAIILLIIGLARAFLIWPLGVSDHQAGKLIGYLFSGNALGAMALVVLIGCLVFRDAVMIILYGMPNLICKFAEHEEKKRDLKDDLRQLMENKDKDCIKQKESSVQSLKNSDIQKYVNLALKKIGREFGREVQHEMRLVGTSYIFDGLMRAGERLYGIEVKFGVSNRSIDMLMHRIERLRVEMNAKERDRFAFILCIVASEKDDAWKDSLLSELSRKYPELILKTYNISELKSC